MFVIDLDALQTINVLHLIGNVDSKRLRPLQTKDVMRIRRAIDNHLTLVDDLTVVHHDVLVLRNQVLVRHPLKIGDDQTLLTFRILTEGNCPGILRQNASILGGARFEQLSNTWQTARNITGFSRFLWQTRHHIAH